MTKFQPRDSPINIEQFNLLVKDLPAAVALLDRNLRYLLVSQGWMQQHRCDDSTIGRSFDQAIPQLPTAWRQIYTPGLPCAEETCLEEPTLLTDGARWLKWQTRPWRDAGGAIAGLMVYTEDITQHKQTEAALRQVNEQLEHRVDERTRELKQAVEQLRYEIAERQQMERALQREQEFVRVLIDNLSNGVIACDAEGNLTVFNRTSIDWHGIDPRGIPLEERMKHYEIYQFDGTPLLSLQNTPLMRAFRGETSRHFPMMIAARNQPPRLVLTDADPLYDAAGRQIGAVAVMHDITERKRVEAALRQKEQLLASIYNGVDYGIFVVDVLISGEFRYAAFNPVAEQMIGLASDQYSGRTPEDLFPAAVAATIRQQFIQCAQTRTTVRWEHAAVFQGVAAWHLATLTPLIDDEGRVYRLIGTTINIDDRKQSETVLHQRTQQLEQALHDLQQAQAQLVQTEKMSSLGQLVAGVAHEINNPVNFIYGNLAHADEYIASLLNLLRLYQQHYPNPAPAINSNARAIDLEFVLEDLPKLLTSMKIGAERIQQIVLSLRNFSRTDEAAVKPVNIHDGIDSTLMILQSRLKSAGSIRVVRQYGSLPLVECYAGQLNQVFMNILSNAIDAIDAHTASASGKPIALRHAHTILIRTEVLDGQRVRIQIADNGPGMSEAVRQRLFEPFFTTKPAGKGTGLGLSISYQVVVDKHGGSLSCVSAPGQGAKFLIDIPIHRGSWRR